MGRQAVVRGGGARPPCPAVAMALGVVVLYAVSQTNFLCRMKHKENKQLFEKSQHLLIISDKQFNIFSSEQPSKDRD